MKIFNILKICLGFVIVFGLSACDNSPEAVAKRKSEQQELRNAIDSFNERNINNPITVGTTKSGNKISVSHVKYSCETCNPDYPDDHYIYFVDGTTSDNYTYRSGKIVRNKVEVVLNNNPTPEQVIAEGERLKKLEEDTERQTFEEAKETYEKLKSKYEQQVR
jgi:hypothetical protein